MSMPIATSPAPAVAARVVRRSLMPKEHGAYGQLFFPLLTALAFARAQPAAVALAISAGALFFAHEPVLVLLGQRGQRAKAEVGALARQRLVQLGLLAAVSGIAGLTLAPVTAWIAALVPVGFAALLTPLVLEKREKTTLGECLAACSLATIALPVALAGHAPLGATVGATAVWCCALLTATFSVRALIAFGRSKPFTALQAGALLWASLPLAAALFLADTGRVPLGGALSLVPMTLFCVGLFVLAPANRYLRETGWALIGASALTLGALVAAFL